MSQNSYTETEVKLYVPDLAAVEQRLQAVGAQLVAPRVLERNVRYDTADGRLAASGQVLRLRQDTRVRLTYKDQGAALHNSALTRFEAEVEVSDFEVMQTILAKLGYAPSMAYEKYRTTYALDEVEVALDELPLGSFVEIEGEVKAIEQTVARLGLSAARRYPYSYAKLFDHVRRSLGLPFTDLTFANFAGIAVPEAALATPGDG
ncbi:MAG: class IV adenylate cyclase [Aggregatilineales bacterium]